MPQQITDKTDIKIFILYLLRQIERPVDFVTLNDIVVQDGFVNQFDFMDCFYELCESEAVKKFISGENELFVITDKGTMVAETLQSNIIRTIRERSVRSALRLLSFRSRGAKASCSLEDEKDGKCCLNCRAQDAGGVFMQVSLLLDTRHQAELMKQNCDENPELLYRGILGVLSGDINYLADAWADDEEYTEEQ